MKNPVIKIEHLSKHYRLGRIDHKSLLTGLYNSTKDLISGHKKNDIPPDNRLDNDGQRFWALRDINLEIFQGDRVALVGHNGAGKSTLLKLIARTTAPSQGKIKIKGRISSMLEIGTGFHPDLTGRENIFLSGAILGMRRSEIQKKFNDIVDFSEISEFLDTPVKRYSSGMYVRLAFSVAAHLDSEIIILDEVLSVGDAGFQKKCIEKVKSMTADGNRTILFVSHNSELVREMSVRKVFLREGRIEKMESTTV